MTRDLFNPVGLLCAACRRHPFYGILWRVAREEVEQLAQVTVWLLGEEATKAELLRYFWRELYHLGRELGLRLFFHQSRQYESRLRVPPCVVCGQPGVYCDPDWGRLCRRHGMTVRARRKRGGDPTAPLHEKKQERTTRSHPIPRRNREFWMKVWLSVDDESWTKMWEWADGKCTAPPVAILEALRRELLK